MGRLLLLVSCLFSGLVGAQTINSQALKSSGISSPFNDSAPTVLWGFGAIEGGSKVSAEDGSAMLQFIIGWHSGKQPCKVRLAVEKTAYMEDYGYGNGFHEVDFNPVNNVDHLVQGQVFDIQFDYPGDYKLSVVSSPIDLQSGANDCSWVDGSAKPIILSVIPHEQYPCSLYPGLTRQTFGDLWGCFPEQSPASNVQDHSDQCEPGTQFVNYSGYVFGCIDPALFEE